MSVCCSQIFVKKNVDILMCCLQAPEIWMTSLCPSQLLQDLMFQEQTYIREESQKRERGGEGRGERIWMLWHTHWIANSTKFSIIDHRDSFRSNKTIRVIASLWFADVVKTYPIL